MDVRRVTAAAGAVGLNALAGFAMFGLADHAPPVRDARVEPVVARLIEPPPPPPPTSVPAPAPVPVPVRRTEAAQPAPRRESAPQATVRKAAAPVEAEQTGATAAPAATPPSAPAPVAPAPSAAPTQAVTAPAIAAPSGGTASPSGPIASVAPGAAETIRRSGPRVDASWAGNAPPAYPAVARRLGEQGEVRLDVHVGVDGQVIEVQLRASSGSPALDRSAIDAVRRWRFRPATVDGQAVPEWYRDWKWVFRLEG